MVVGSTINKHGGKELKKYRLIVLLVVLMVLSSLPVFAGEWSEPQLWQHTTTDVVRMPWLTPDNTLYFVFRYDIYQSNWTGEEWTEPVSVPGPINTNNNEISPVVVQNGTVMYFARYQETTDYDFYRSEWDEAKGQWGKPERVGPWNTPEQEWGLWVSENDDLAYLGSRGTYGGITPLGGRDLWVSKRDGDGNWTIPVNVGKPLNTEHHEWSPFVDREGKIYFDSNRPGGKGDYSIWVASDAHSEPALFELIDSEGDEREIAMNDTFLVFSAQKRPGNLGGYDLWISVKQDLEEKSASAGPPADPKAPSALAALGSGLTVDYTLEGHITLSFDDGDNLGSVNYKPMMFGAVIVKGEPVKGLNTYLRMRHRNYTTGTTDEGNLIWVDKYMVSADILGVTSRVFWNDAVKAYKSPFNIVDPATIKANVNTPDGAVNGLDFTAKDLYGFDFYGFYVPQYRRLVAGHQFLQGRAMRDLRGYEASFSYEYPFDFTISRSEVNIGRTHKATAYNTQWAVWGLEFEPIENLEFGVHRAQMQVKDPSKGLWDEKAGVAYYATAGYALRDGTYTLGYKTADERFASPYWEVDLGKVLDRFPTNSKGLEFGVTYKLLDGLTVGYSGDFINIEEGKTKQNKNTFKLDAVYADFTAAAKLEFGSRAVTAGGGAVVTASASEVDLKTTYVPYDITGGILLNTTASDAPGFEAKREALYSLEAATFENVLAKVHYRNIDKILRGELQYKVTPDTTVTAMYKTKHVDPESNEKPTHRFIKLEKIFNASNKITISYGVDDVVGGRMVIDKGWGGEPPKSHNYLKIAFNTKF